MAEWLSMHASSPHCITCANIKQGGRLKLIQAFPCKGCFLLWQHARVRIPALSFFFIFFFPM